MKVEKRRLLSKNGRWGLFFVFLAIALGMILVGIPHYWYGQILDLRVERENKLRLIEAKLASLARRSGPLLTDEGSVLEMFLKGTTPGTATAEFQTLLNTSAEKAGMVIERLQPMDTETRGDISVITMEIVAFGNLESLRTYLMAIETSLPIIFITDADISPQNTTQSSFPSESLMVNLRLQAFQARETMLQ